MTRDLTTSDITTDLLEVQRKGQEELRKFVGERLISSPDKQHGFRDPLPKNKTLTFSSLYNMESKIQDKKVKTLKVDQSIMQRLIIASQAGRDLNLKEILKHELLPVPISLAEMNGYLRSGSKAMLVSILTEDIQCPPTLEASDLGNDATFVIDGQALVVARGMPDG